MTATQNVIPISKSCPVPPVRCDCGHVLFDAVVFRSRVLRRLPDDSIEAKCRCKRWVKLPLVYVAR